MKLNQISSENVLKITYNLTNKNNYKLKEICELCVAE